MSMCHFQGVVKYTDLFYDIYDIDTYDYIHSFTQVRTLHMDRPLQIQWSTWTKDDLAYLNSVKENIHS